jgi:hypothetical protein
MKVRAHPRQQKHVHHALPIPSGQGLPTRPNTSQPTDFSKSMRFDAVFEKGG